MEQLIIVAHVLIAVAIIALILLQQGKGADMGASFGAGSSQTVFGPRGSANVLTRVTAVLVALFFATSFALALVARHHAGTAGQVDIPVPAAVQDSASKNKPAGAGAQQAPAGQSSVPAVPAGSDVPGGQAPAASRDNATGDVPQASGKSSGTPASGG